ncbi:hypothetical protein GF371_03535, partial [Candidatus Woesearchaeota archaeon]|nr:hypothetical protein [Candidatus Woesearchaeota archaeon]
MKKKKIKKRGFHRKGGTKQAKNAKKAVAVFFDLDKTLIKFNSAVKLCTYLFFKGELPFSFFLRSSFYGALYLMKLYDFSKMLKKLWKT